MKDPPAHAMLALPFLDLHFGKSHMDCYHFCKQCEDHFETVRATGSNYTLFATSFLFGIISFQ